MPIFELVRLSWWRNAQLQLIHDQRAVREPDTHNRFSPFRHAVARMLGLAEDTLIAIPTGYLPSPGRQQHPTYPGEMCKIRCRKNTLQRTVWNGSRRLSRAL